MKLTVLGSGDAFGSGGRHNSCYHLASEETSFLIDCGAGAMANLRLHNLDPLEIDTIFISHLHGDHFSGLPAFILDAVDISKRDTPLILVGPKSLQEKLEALFVLLYEGINLQRLPFDIRYAALNQFQLLSSNGVTVQAFRAKHTATSDPYSLRFSCEKKVIAYSGDTAWNDKLLSVASDADLFISECSRWDEESEVHLDYFTLSRKKEKLKAKLILLTHMNPDMLEKQSEIDDEYFAVASDGYELEI